MKKSLKYIIGIVVVALVAFLIICLKNNIGVSKSKIEQDARDSQHIPNDWQVSKDITDKSAAMIFYNKSLDESTFSIYANHDGFSFRYFFVSGGSSGLIMDSVEDFSIDGCEERAYISMNKPKINKVVIDNGKEVETKKIDSTKPFAFIHPSNVVSVTFYDVDGNIVERE